MRQLAKFSTYSLSVLLLALALLRPSLAEAGIYGVDAEVTYKEYWIPHSEFTGGCGSHEVPEGGSWYLEPWPCTKTLQFEIPDDLSQALKVEIYLDLWRNHNEPAARFSLNGGPTHTPDVGYDWSRTPYIAEIPKSELQQGTNTISFWNEGDRGYHVHDIAFRVYYDQDHPLLPGLGSDVTPPNGQLTAIVASNGTFLPTAGGTLGVDNDQLTLDAIASGGDVRFVEFHAYYYGYDEDNDGEFLDWHNLGRNNYHPGGTSPKSYGGTIDHIGTDTSVPYSVTWDLSHIQNQSGVKFKIRIVDNAGNVREAAGGVSADFTLSRADTVETYLIPGFQDAVLHHGGTYPDAVTRFIDLPNDLSDLSKAYIVGAYWQNPWVKINNNTAFKAFNPGEDVWGLSIKEIPVSHLQPGQNRIDYEYNPDQIDFGQFVERPGPMIVLRRSDPAFSVSKSTLYFAGEEGVLNPGVQYFGITNTGGGPINWNVGILGSSEWLGVVPSSGLDDGAVTVSASTAGLGVGVYTDTLIVSAQETTATVAISVTLNVTSEAMPIYLEGFETYPPGEDPEDWIDTKADNSMEDDTLFKTFDLSGERVFGTTFTETNIYSHYVGAGSDTFSSYEYSGRMMTTSADGGIGVTFLSQYPQADIYYRLRRHGSDGSFYISPHGTSITGGTTDTGVIPDPNVWYRFKIQVEDVGTRTEIRAKVWREGDTEPATWQVDSDDNSATRLAAGTIGVWSYSSGSKYWDDLAVHPLPPEPDESFPFTYGHDPASGVTSVDPTSAVSVHVADIGTGVDAATLTMTVGSALVTPTITGNLFDYTLTYDPPSDFAPGEVVTVTIDACDLYVPPHCMATDEYSFTVGLPPIIDIWYGSEQRFGHIGTPQRWINILGNVSDPDGVASLFYSLNGGPHVSLSMGPDNRRLALEGDFNVDIDHADLVSGSNQVVITATDNIGQITVETVTVQYTDTNTWPHPYTIDWSTVTDIQDVAQVVDGKWAVEADGVRPVEADYDRLIAIGDLSWTDYEVTVPIIIHNVDIAGSGGVSGGPGLGLLMRWTGHTDSPIYGWQPKTGWEPFGTIGWWRWSSLSSAILQFYQTGASQSFTPALEVPYIFKMRVESTPGQGGLYSLKVWEDDQPEPSEWDLTYQAESSNLANGSFTLLAHHVDASFGDVTVTPGPFEDTTPPVISNVQVSPGETSATVTWTTNEPATSSVAYGQTTAYENGSVDDSALVTNHTIVLTDLTSETLYHYQVTSVDGSDNSAISADLTFTTTGAPGPSSIVSDDFNTCSLDTELWTFINPLGDATQAMTGTFTQDAWVSISVPTGSGHDVWEDGNFAPRIMQPADDTDFEIEVKFESGLSQQYQMQGVLIEEDGDDFLRFDFYADGSDTRLFAAIFEPGSSKPLEPTVKYDQVITDTNVAPLYMRVKREGDQWTQSYSYDGLSWTPRIGFTHTLAVTSVGAFVGNTAGGSSPAHTGYIDYFFDTASPIVPEDGDRNTLTVNVVGSGTVAKDPDWFNYPCSQVITLTATADPGWSFIGWDGALSGSDNPAILIMTGEKAVTASFVVSGSDPCQTFLPFVILQSP